MGYNQELSIKKLRYKMVLKADSRSFQASKLVEITSVQTYWTFTTGHPRLGSARQVVQLGQNLDFDPEKADEPKFLKHAQGQAIFDH